LSDLPKRILIETPPFGGKAWLLDSKGLFVLEEGPGMLVTIACTHAGSGSFEVYDGIPDEKGYFPEIDEDATELERAVAPGRIFFRMHPVVMGSWMLNAGFRHGLTMRAVGGHETVAGIATIVWQPMKRRVAPPPAPDQAAPSRPAAK